MFTPMSLGCVKSSFLVKLSQEAVHENRKTLIVSLFHHLSYIPMLSLFNTNYNYIKSWQTYPLFLPHFNILHLKYNQNVSNIQYTEYD